MKKALGVAIVFLLVSGALVLFGKVSNYAFAIYCIGAAIAGIFTVIKTFGKEDGFE